MCDQQRLWLSQVSYASDSLPPLLLEDQWSLALPGQCRYLDVAHNNSDGRGSVGFQLIDGRLEVWTFRLLDGQMPRQVQQLDYWTPNSLALRVPRTSLSVDSSLFTREQTVWPVGSFGAAQSLTLPLCGRLLLNLGNDQWLVLGGEVQTLQYNKSGQWSSQPRFPLNPNTELSSVEAVRSMVQKPVVLDWARLAVVQQGNALLLYSLESHQYRGYWALPDDCTLLLDALGKNLLFLSKQWGTLMVRNYQLQSSQYLHLPLDLPMVKTYLLCGELQVCVLYSDGQVHIYWLVDPELSNKKHPPVPQSLKIDSLSALDPHLSNPRRLMWDEFYSELVMVCSDLQQTLYFVRLAMPVRYSSALLKKPPQWVQSSLCC